MKKILIAGFGSQELTKALAERIAEMRPAMSIEMNEYWDKVVQQDIKFNEMKLMPMPTLPEFTIKKSPQKRGSNFTKPKKKR